jgi:glycerate-2-kinase
MVFEINRRKAVLEIFLASVESVKPDNLIHKFMQLNKNILQIDEIAFDLSAIKNIYVVGAGKASAIMAKAVESVLGSRITSGQIVTKYDHAVPLKFIGLTEAGHPVPDENGLNGTARIISIVDKAGEDDLVICLISGGGSALLTDVPEGCTLEEMKTLNDILLKCGANINEINCIRKHLSKVKGGQLSKAAYPARVISLILSDVIGDPIDVIASGPTAADPSTYSEAISIVNKYKIENDLPDKILQILYEGFEKKQAETLKETDRVFLNTINKIIGNNRLALQTARVKAEDMGYETQILTDKISGDVSQVASFILSTITSTKLEKPGRKLCLLMGGEPTLKVTGSGRGGRNQHLALVIADLMKGQQGTTILCCGTDGTDGPTDAAGAVVDSFTSLNASKLNLDIEQFIRNFDSYNFFKQEGGLIITGPTQTNVMDLMLILVE